MFYLSLHILEKLEIPESILLGIIPCNLVDKYTSSYRFSVYQLNAVMLRPFSSSDNLWYTMADDFRFHSERLCFLFSNK